MSRSVFTPSEMSPHRRPDPMSPAAQAALARMAIEAGQRLRDERLRRRWTLQVVADRAGVALSVVHDAEAGRVSSLQSYARIAAALGLRPSLEFADGHARRGATAAPDPRRDAEDFVHAAMGELEARVLARQGRTLGIDEPYQHFQFAGRADLLAWEGRDLLHIENRTRFPNLQEAAGSYNAKRQYLARALGERLGIGPRGWRSVTHVMACLWSAEVLHVLRLRRATFAAICPDGPAAFEAWLAGEQPAPGTTSTLILLDPTVPFGSRRRSIASLADLPKLDPRHRGYAEAAIALRQTG